MSNSVSAKSRSDEAALDRVCREDLLLFANAGLTATGQGGYYHGVEKTRLSLSFLHEYICVNYRHLYTVCLASGLNDHNISHGISCLLASGAPVDPVHRQSENRLLALLMDQLPAHRAYRLIEHLADKRINNRRSRALVKRFLNSRRDLSFDAIKYRRRFRKALLHAHVQVAPELARFAFEGPKGKRYQTPLLETYRRAHYDTSAIYRLPFSVASGLAQKKGVARGRFMEKIQPMMTEREKLRHQRTGSKTFDSRRLDLVELCVYYLDSRDEERAALLCKLTEKTKQQAERFRFPKEFRTARIATILDRSRSSFGTVQRKRRPLAVTLALHLLLEECAAHYEAFWTSPTRDLQGLHPRGYTDLATSLMTALETRPDLVILISDGRENVSAGACEALASMAKLKLKKPPLFLHLNPVYDPDDFMPKAVGPSWPVVGVAKASDLSVALALAGFTQGASKLDDLREFLVGRVERS